MKRWSIFAIVIVFLFGGFYLVAQKTNWFSQHQVGDVLDSLNGVKVYYNGPVDHVSERNIAPNGYNLGLKYQCVEFVKRYYFERLNHEMPYSYGHAKEMFDTTLTDGDFNSRRGLLQFRNPSSSTSPRPDDIIVMDGTLFNEYGHVGIVAWVAETELEMIQQNPGTTGNSRIRFPIIRKDNSWRIDNNRVLGWLRKEKKDF